MSIKMLFFFLNVWLNTLYKLMSHGYFISSKRLKMLGFKHMIPGLQGFVYIKRMYIMYDTEYTMPIYSI